MSRRAKRAAGGGGGRPGGSGLSIDQDGRASGVRYVASPNCDDRPPGTAISLLVVHNISLPPGEFGGDDVTRLFTNSLGCDEHPFYAGLRGVRVSAHFFVRRCGTVIQFVPCLKRAWHAGQSRWRGRTACNDFSIGIELEGTDDLPYADPQYEALAGLARTLAAAYPIEDVVGHADIAPGRKSDPGPAFDWGRFESLVGRVR